MFLCFTFQFICSKEGSEAVLQCYHGTPKPAGDTGDYKPENKHHTHRCDRLKEKNKTLTVLCCEGALIAMKNTRKEESLSKLSKEYELHFNGSEVLTIPTCHIYTPISPNSKTTRGVTLLWLLPTKKWQQRHRHIIDTHGKQRLACVVQSHRTATVAQIGKKV